MKTQKYTRFIICFLCILSLQSYVYAQGVQQEVVYTSTYGNGQAFGYLEYLPIEYGTSEEDFPVLISLHGLGWRAEGNSIEFSKLRQGNHVAKLIEAGRHFPAIVISPQQPKNVNGRYSGRGSWDENIIDEVLERVKDLRRVDTNRIYITGTSMGGGGVWKYLKFHGDKIAAAAPICGTRTIGSGDASLPKVKDTPVWAFHNYGDNVVNVSNTEQIISWIKSNNPTSDVRKTIYAWSGHNSWDATYSGEGRDTTSNSSNQIEYGIETNKPDIFEWLFTHNLSAPYPIQAYVTDENSDELVIEFSQVVNQASSGGFQFNDSNIQVASLKSGLGSSKLVFSLNKALSVGKVVNISYNHEQGDLSGENGYRTTAFSEFEVENKVGFIQLDSRDIAVDFGNGSKSVPEGWNQINNFSQGSVISNVKSIDGTVSNVVVRTLTNWPGAFADGTTTGNNSGVFPDAVMETFWTVGSDEERLVIEGLETDQNYNIYFFASRASSNNIRVTDYTIQGNTVSLDARMNTNQTVKITGATPDSDGKVFVSMQRPSDSQYGYIGAIVIRKSEENTSQPINQVPVVTVCSDTLVKLPVDQILLVGSAEDSDGTIVQKEWNQKSGPAPARLSQDNLGQAVIRDVAEGEYIFEFSATDDQGGTDSDEVLVVVEPQNIPPTVDAGADVTITLPLDSVQLNGSASDTDGTIASYQWVLQSGPNTFSIENAGDVQTWVNDFVAGTYLFNLIVVDDAGATALDEVQVQVLENQAPLVEADDTVMLRLPQTSTTLSVNAEDIDGEISTITWSQLSGPSSAQLSGSNSEELGVSDLTQGSYTFGVVVVDNGGASNADSVVLKVMAEEDSIPSNNEGDSISSDEIQYYAGLRYQYYEGDWNMLPNFSGLVAVKTGEVASFTLSPREQDSYFAFKFAGYIDITTEGMYTLYTASDDGSKLYIDGEEVVDNDGRHSKVEKSGQVYLTVGKHAIKVTYFEKWGGQTLEVKYEGPGISKQFIPAEVLFYADEESSNDNAYAGLRYQYYEGDWNMLPNFSGLVAVKTGEVASFTLSPREQDSYFAFKFAGYIDITTEGMYTLYTASDDGSKLYIDGEEVVDNDGRHSKVEKSGQVYLTVGKHAIKVTYFEKWGGQTLEVKYEGPGISKQFIPAEVLFYADEENQKVLEQVKVSQVETMTERSVFQQAVSVRTFPNPVQDELHISLGEERSVEIRLLDNFGNAIHTVKSFDQQSITIDLTGLNIAKGAFVLMAVDTENNQLILSKKMLRMR